MKYILLSIILFFTLFTSGQSDIRQITCLGETVKNIETDQISSSNRDTGTIFTINENDKTIKVKTATRFQGVFIDEFYYQDFIESPYAKIYTCYRNGDREKTKYFISVLSEKMTLMTGSKIIESNIVSDRTFVDENYEDLSSEMPNQRIGQINGTNVIFRENHSTNSKIIGSFKKSGEKIEILDEYLDKTKTQLLLKNDKKITIDNKTHELGSGMAIDLISQNENSITASFKDKNLESQTIELSESDVLFVNDSKWFKIKRQNGTIGWVFGKFITE